MPFIVAVGEAMLELSRGGVGLSAWRLQHGGDTINVATYLARLGNRVSYLTAMGEDPFSQQMIAEWRNEGIGTELALTHPTRLPGLYVIETDDNGERTFHYWRDNSAARALFACNGVELAFAAAARANCLYLSGITLSLFDERGRRRLQQLCAAVRVGGGIVAFDPNYRPKGWPSAVAARAAIAQIAPHVTIALPTLSDEKLLHGDDSLDGCRRRWLNAGVQEVAVKMGPKGAIVTAGGDEVVVPTEENTAPRDTTGAGDSFNAAYLSARLRDQDTAYAARAGNALAAAVVRQPGAIINRVTMPLGHSR